MNGLEIYNDILDNTHNLKGTWEVTEDNYLNVTGNTNGSIVLFDKTVGALGDFILEWTAEQKGGSYIHSNLCPSLRYTPEDAGIEGGGDNYAMLVYLCNYGGNPGTFNLRTENGTKSTVNTSGVSLNLDTVYTFKLERLGGTYRLYQDGVLINEATDITKNKLYLGWYLWYGGTNSSYQTNFILREYNLTKIDTKSYLDTIGLTSLWSKIKSLFATKTELGSKANDSEVVHKSGNETIAATKTFSSNIVGNLTGNADTATKATQDSDGNQINTTYSKNGHTHDDRYYTESEVNNLLNGKANDADVVHKSGDETIAGSKTFNNIKLIGNNDLITNTSDSSYTTIVGGTSSNNSPFLQLVGNTWGYEPNRGMFILSANNGTTRCDLQGKLPNGELYWGGKVIYGLDNTCDLGNSNKRFKDIYATNATINTSDRNAKQDISVIDDKLLDAWGNINPVTFKLISSIEHKGDNARIHTGYIAQDVKEELDKYGIDACKYGLFCYNSWDVQEEKSHEEERTDEEGNTKTVKVIDTPAREAGETYGLRYIECLVVECAYLRKKNKELEERITKLEENLYA